LKAEMTPTSKLSPLRGPLTAIGDSIGSGGNTSLKPCGIDIIYPLEALAVVIGLQCSKVACLIDNTGELTNGKPIMELTEKAKTAFSDIFNECLGLSRQMGQREILKYMKILYVDMCDIPQKIINILTKYGKESSYLTLDGFLAYYRDISQENELQARLDLHTFGYRPDLSRRSKKARFFFCDGQQHLYQRAESVAIDVHIIKEETGHIALGTLANIGLLSFNFYLTIYNRNKQLAEYILAYCAYKIDTKNLIYESLDALNRAHSGCTSSDIVKSCIMVCCFIL